MYYDQETYQLIVDLSDNAASAGDLDQVAICDLALLGDEDAFDECLRVIEDAEAAAFEPEIMR